MLSQINDILYHKGATASDHEGNILEINCIAPFFFLTKVLSWRLFHKSDLSFTISVLAKVLGFALQAAYKLIGGIN